MEPTYSQEPKQQQRLRLMDHASRPEKMVISEVYSVHNSTYKQVYEMHKVTKVVEKQYSLKDKLKRSDRVLFRNTIYVMRHKSHLHKKLKAIDRIDEQSQQSNSSSTQHQQYYLHSTTPNENYNREPQSLKQMPSSSSYHQKQQQQFKQSAINIIVSQPEEEIRYSSLTSFESHQQKYTRFEQKITLLENNLNRLYSQHNNLKEMIEGSDKIKEDLKVLDSIENLEGSIQEVKMSHFIQKKRAEARLEVAFDEYHQKFQTIKAQIESQRSYLMDAESKAEQHLMELRNKIKQFTERPEESYSSQILTPKTQTIRSVKGACNSHLQQALRYCSQYLQKAEKTIKDQFDRNHSAFIEDKMAQKSKWLMRRCSKLNDKISGLNCLIEYQMYLAKEAKIKNQMKLIHGRFGIGEERDLMMGLMDLNLLMEEQREVVLENVERMEYEIGRVDMKLIEVANGLEFLEGDLKERNIRIESCSGRSENLRKIYYEKSGNDQTTLQISKGNLKADAVQLQQDLSELCEQLKGLKKYYYRTKRKIIRSIEEKGDQSEKKIDICDKQVYRKQTEKYEGLMGDLDKKVTLLMANIEVLKETQKLK